MVLQNASHLMAGIIVSMGLLLPAPELNRPENPADEMVREYLSKPTAFPDVFYDTFDWGYFEQWEPVSQAIDYNNVDYNLLNAAIFHFTNKYRIDKKLNRLTFSKQLRDAAVFHSLKMVKNGFYGHINKRDRLFRTSVARAQYFGYPTTVVGENIAYQYFLGYKDGQKFWYRKLKTGEVEYYYGSSLKAEKTIPELTYLQYADALVNQWIDSNPHEDNILNPHYKYLGCGFAPDVESYTVNKIPQSIATQNFGA